ncbi:MAG: molybdopterin-dependent oxidoreductase [Actinobacteria bacterium]|nr:molybdopterin-dependent oxidoreductase [Actinomycetota bacterium]
MGSLKSYKHYHWLTILTILVAVLAVMLGACGTDTTTTSTTTDAAAATTTDAVDATTTEAEDAADTPDATASEPVSGTIVVKGMVDNPITLTADVLQAMNPVTITATHPKMGDQEYTGVRLSDLLTTLEVQSTATTLLLGATDGFMAEISLADIEATPDAMIAIDSDGRLNGVMPGMSGKAWVKDIVSMDLK